VLVATYLCRVLLLTSTLVLATSQWIGGSIALVHLMDRALQGEVLLLIVQRDMLLAMQMVAVGNATSQATVHRGTLWVELIAVLYS
jgi:hypothetical protein